MTRRTTTITRVDIRVPNHLYEQIQALATRHFRAKIHHRSGKPEVSPTILELIKIGIAHLGEELPDTADISDKSGADELRQQIKELDTRLREVEGKLSGDQSDKLPDKDAPSDSSSQVPGSDAEGTSDESSQGITKASLEPIFERLSELLFLGVVASLA